MASNENRMTGEVYLKMAFVLVCLVTLVTSYCGGAAPQKSGGVANTPATNTPTQMKTLQFSGYEWLIKTSDERVGPGPNYFSDTPDNIFVDAAGQLHLRITERDGRWFCAEIVSGRSFGYGTYTFHVNTQAESLDPQAVLGLFTWNDDAAYAHREIDIEISRWGRANNQNAQFVVQPYIHPGNIVRFQMPSALSSSVHSFSWKPDNVHFQSAGAAQTVIKQHTFTKDIPIAGGENVRMNLWLMAARPPTNGKPVEVIISKFEFRP
jgi:hypothetical protein